MKLWVPSRIGGASLRFQFCGDTYKKHNMTVFRTIVYVRPHVSKSKGDTRWFLLYKRPKGYWIAGIFTTEELSGKIVSERKPDGSLKYVDGYSISVEMFNDMYDMFINDPQKYYVAKSSETYEDII